MCVTGVTNETGVHRIETARPLAPLRSAAARPNLLLRSPAISGDLRRSLTAASCYAHTTAHEWSVPPAIPRPCALSQHQVSSIPLAFVDFFKHFPSRKLQQPAANELARNLFAPAFLVCRRATPDVAPLLESPHAPELRCTTAPQCLPLSACQPCLISPARSPPHGLQPLSAHVFTPTPRTFGWACLIDSPEAHLVTQTGSPSSQLVTATLRRAQNIWLAVCEPLFLARLPCRSRRARLLHRMDHLHLLRAPAEVEPPPCSHLLTPPYASLLSPRASLTPTWHLLTPPYTSSQQPTQPCTSLHLLAPPYISREAHSDAQAPTDTA